MARKKTVITEEFERGLVQLLANDTRIKETAQIYGVKEKTMNSRITQIRLKYGQQSIAGLCVHFYKQGWIT